MVRVENIKVKGNLSEDEVLQLAYLKGKIAKSDIISSSIVKKSLDARDKNNIHYLYSVDVDVKNTQKYSYLKQIEPPNKITIVPKRKSLYHPIIVGTGPAGLFCALTLIEYGYKPILIEQGDRVENRIKYVEEYRQTGKLNPLCNIQFGEGGAGTFSDGKLNTNTHSPYIKKVLEYFHQFGAPKEITYLNKPHIGTDNLRIILKNIRTYIEDKGGKYYFNTKMEDFQKQDNYIKVICSDNQEFTTDALVLAIGHSARDTYKMLQNKGILLQRKNFAVGLRIEHKQQTINSSQYGNKTSMTLPPADYKLVYHGKERSCFTFCMCPGGEVMASASENDAIVTNGMSNYNRDKENANSALLVNVLTTDFKGDNPLAGMYFQEKLEKDAYILGGKNSFAPIQRVEDFLNNTKSTKIGSIIPTYKPGVTLTNLNQILPNFISKTLQEGISYFGTKIKGFDNPDAILTGVETRSSAPVTIVRNNHFESSHNGIYPCGEGAGYAGGITSSCVDGIKVAIQIIEKEDENENR